MDNPYTARITSGVGGFDLVEFVTGPDEDVYATCRVAHYDGQVVWATDADLAKADTLEVAGIHKVRVANGSSEYRYV